jgi:hypothetical protein
MELMCLGHDFFSRVTRIFYIMDHFLSTFCYLLNILLKKTTVGLRQALPSNTWHMPPQHEEAGTCRLGLVVEHAAVGSGGWLLAPQAGATCCLAGHAVTQA